MLILTSRSTRAIRTRRVFDPNQPRHRNSPRTGDIEDASSRGKARGLNADRARFDAVKRAAPYGAAVDRRARPSPCVGLPLHRMLRLRNGRRAAREASIMTAAVLNLIRLTKSEIIAILF